VQWKGRAETYDLAVPHVDDKNFQFAVGNTTTEALAALLADRLRNPAVEPLLEAFSEDQLAQNADLTELESTLHAQRFGSVAGGQEFATQKKSATSDQTASGTDVTLPDDLERALVALNGLQRDFERKQRQFDSSRWELYAAWHKRAQEYTKPARKEPAD